MFESFSFFALITNLIPGRTFPIKLITSSPELSGFKYTDNKGTIIISGNSQNLLKDVILPMFLALCNVLAMQLDLRDILLRYKSVTDLWDILLRGYLRPYLQSYRLCIVGGEG